MSGAELFIAGMQAAGAAGSTAAVSATAYGAGVAAATALPYLGVATTLMSTYGAYQQSKAMEAGYKSDAAMAEYNAKVGQMEASAEETRRRTEARRHLSRMRTGYAKGGVTMEGTPLLAMEQSAEMAEIDALNARWGGMTNAALDRARAAQSTYAAKQTAASRPYTVGASLLSGMSKVGGPALSATARLFKGSSSSSSSTSDLGRYSSIPNQSIRSYA